MRVLLIAGARPNFMKIAPLYRTSKKYPDVDCRIVHTGQHYDQEMSQAFFEDLELPLPDFHLEAGSETHAVQTAKIMTAFEKICMEEKPDWVVVVGVERQVAGACVNLPHTASTLLSTFWIDRMPWWEVYCKASIPQRWRIW